MKISIINHDSHHSLRVEIYDIAVDHVQTKNTVLLMPNMGSEPKEFSVNEQETVILTMVKSELAPSE